MALFDARAFHRFDWAVARRAGFEATEINDGGSARAGAGLLHDGESLRA